MTRRTAAPAPAPPPSRPLAWGGLLARGLAALLLPLSAAPAWLPVVRRGDAPG
jgi:hypothetical protein